MALSLIGAVVALADCGDVVSASLSGSWQLRTTVTSFSGGPSPFVGAKVGDQAVDAVSLTPTCTAVGHCSIVMQGTVNSFQIFDATGFYYDSTPLVQAGSSYTGTSGAAGFGGPNLPKCPPPRNLERNTLTLTVVAAVRDTAGAWHATQVSGDESIPYGWVCVGGVGQTVGVEHIAVLAVPAGVPFPVSSIPACAVPSPAATPVVKAATTAAPQPSRSAVGNPEQSSISSSLASPAAAFGGSPLRSILNGLITIGVILFVTFPAHLFNKTFEDNYDDIRDIVSKRFRWLRRLRSRIGKPGSARRLGIFAAVILAGAVLGGLNDPEFGINRRSAATYLAVVLAILFSVTISTSVSRVYRRLRKRDRVSYLHALPAGLAVAASCVLISRLTAFQPGYVYGVICGVAFAKKLARHEEGHNVVLSAVITLSIGVLAWLAWIPTNDAARHPGAAFVALVAATFLSAVFVGGLVGQVIGLMPLNFLPGGTLVRWSRAAWVATFGVAVFGLVEVMLRPESTSAHAGNAPLVTAIVLFVLFGGVSVGFWAFFEVRHRRQKRAAAALVDAVLAGSLRPEPVHRAAPHTRTAHPAAAGGNGQHPRPAAPAASSLPEPPEPSGS